MKVGTPNELELYLKADRKIQDVEIIEAHESNIFVVLIRPIFRVRFVCCFWNHYRIILANSYAKKVDDVMSVDVEMNVKLVL